MNRDLVFIAAFGFLALSGCALPTGVLRSRWAMENPEYAEKYSDGADKSDVLGKLKQASDARFVEGASGLYVSGGVSARPDSDSGFIGADIGVENYLASFLTARASLMGMSDSDNYFTGADAGIRLQSPSRLAPFVGLGVFVGTADEEVSANDDFIDNDDDGFVDERGETRERFSGALAAFYPEVGGHFWWTPQVRFTGFGRYFMTSKGRREDDWWIGGGLAIFGR